MKRLFLMCGISFSGKSTLARRLGKRLGAAIVSLDEINGRRGLGENGDAVPDEEWVKTHEIARSELSKRMEGGQDVILDDTHCFRWLRDSYRALAKTHGFETIIVHMNVEAEVAKQRLLENDIEKRRGGLPLDYFLAHANAFEKPGPDEICLTFNSGDDPEKWISGNFRNGGGK